MNQLAMPKLVRYPAVWLLLALVAKGTFFAWYLSRAYYHNMDGFWGQSNGDMMTYLSPIDSLLAHQGFNTDYRMPGYSAVYLAFRLLMSPAHACNAMILSQLVISAFSVYVLGLVARRLFQSKQAFYWAYFIYLFSPFVSVFDAYILTESLAAASSIFFLYALLRFESQPRQWAWLLGAGFWLAFSVFLKPAHAGTLSIPLVIFGYQWLRKILSFRQLIIRSALVLLPFLVADSAWVVRNYRTYHAVIPLLKSPWYPENYWPTNYFPMIAFCETYGEDYSFWFPNAGIRWFSGWGDNNFLPPIRWYVPETLGPPPNYVYTSRFNQDSMRVMRQTFLDMDLLPASDSLKRRTIHADIRRQLVAYTASVKAEKQGVYYGIALARYTFDFLNGTRGYHFLDDMIQTTWPRWLLRAYHWLFVLLPGLIGLAAMLISGLRRWAASNGPGLVPPLMVGYAVVVFAIALRHAETRYLAPFYPFLVLGAVSSFSFLMNRLRNQPPHNRLL